MRRLSAWSRLWLTGLPLEAEGQQVSAPPWSIRMSDKVPRSRINQYQQWLKQDWASAK